MAYTVRPPKEKLRIVLEGIRAMRDRSMEICADARYLPFADGSIAAAHTRSGFNREEQYEILRRLDLFVSKDEFIESLKQEGFGVLSVEDMPESKSRKFIVDS